MAQKDVAERLGIAEATLSRWLNETQIQTRALDNLFRVFLSFPQVRTALNPESQDATLGIADIAPRVLDRVSTQKAKVGVHKPE